MTESKIEITKLTASDGHILTNGEAYGEEVYLGKVDKVENWYEITRAQYDAILEELSAEE